jgi:hypothetical protein
VVPNALEEVELPLALMLKPDVSKALEMPGGVSIVFLSVFFLIYPFASHVILKSLCTSISPPNPDPDPDLARDH